MLINQRGLGFRIQSLRLARNLTQESLSEMIGISSHYLGNIEQGVRTPTLPTFMAICRALGAVPNDLLTDSITDDMRSGVGVCVSETDLRDIADDLQGTITDYLRMLDDDGYFDIPTTLQSPSPFISPFTDEPDRSKNEK